MENEQRSYFPLRKQQDKYPIQTLLCCKEIQNYFSFLTWVLSSPKERNYPRRMVWVIQAEEKICTLRPPAPSFHWCGKYILCPRQRFFSGSRFHVGLKCSERCLPSHRAPIVASRPDKGKLIEESWDLPSPHTKWAVEPQTEPRWVSVLVWDFLEGINSSHFH